MTLRIRKLVVLGIVSAVFLVANALIVANWLNRVGVITWAASIRREFLTGTAITIILALLILLVPQRRNTAGPSAWIRRCPVCGRLLNPRGKYCPGCGSRV